MTSPDWAGSSIASALEIALAPRSALPAGVPARMGMVQARYGSNRASARAVGVDERTWRRWLSGGTRPRAASADKLAAAAAEVRLAGVVAQFRGVQFQQRMGGRDRQREASARALGFDPAANDRITEAARRGDWGTAARIWFSAIRDSAYRQMIDEFADQEYGLTITSISI
jgi:transcriptional regulator with XRE-family HTH domain